MVAMKGEESYLVDVHKLTSTSCYNSIHEFMLFQSILSRSAENVISSIIRGLAVEHIDNISKIVVGSAKYRAVQLYLVAVEVLLFGMPIPTGFVVDVLVGGLFAFGRPLFAPVSKSSV